MPIFSMFNPEGAPNVPMEQIAAQRDADAMRAAMQRYDIQSRERSQERTAGTRASEFDRTLAASAERFKKEQEAAAAEGLARRGVTTAGQNLASGDRRSAMEQSAREHLARESGIQGRYKFDEWNRVQDLIRLNQRNQARYEDKKKLDAAALLRNIAEGEQISTGRQVQQEADLWSKGLQRKTDPQGKRTTELEPRSLTEAEQTDKDKVGLARNLEIENAINSMISTLQQQGQDIHDPQVWADRGWEWNSVKHYVSGQAPTETIERQRQAEIATKIQDEVVAVSEAAFSDAKEHSSRNYDPQEDQDNWEKLRSMGRNFFRGIQQMPPEHVEQAIRIALRPGGALWEAAHGSETPDTSSEEGTMWGYDEDVNPEVHLLDFEDMLREIAFSEGMLPSHQPPQGFDEKRRQLHYKETEEDRRRRNLKTWSSDERRKDLEEKYLSQDRSSDAGPGSGARRGLGSMAEDTGNVFENFIRRSANRLLEHPPMFIGP